MPFRYVLVLPVALSLFMTCTILAPAQTTPDAFGDSTRAARLAEVDRLRAIKDRIRDDILSRPGVIGIGIGESDGQLVFNILVDAGRPVPDMPDVLEGVPLIPVKRKPVRLLHGAPSGCGEGIGPCHNEQQTLPAEMGNAGTWNSGTSPGSCTLGFKACDLGTGLTVFITNSHCNNSNMCGIAQPNSPLSHWIQPGWLDVGLLCLQAGTCSVIGTVSGHAAPSCSGSAVNFTDASKVDSTSAQTSIAIRDIGYPAGAAEVLMGDMVQKSGRTTGLTTGVVTIVGIDSPVPPPAESGFCCGAIMMHDQIEIKFTPPPLPGDSGSAVVRLDPTTAGLWVVGLLYGVGADDQGTLLTYVNRISHVLNALNVSMDFSSCLNECLVVTAAEQMPVGGDDIIDMLRRYRDTVLADSSVGLTLTQIYNQISSEAVRLATASPRLLAETAAIMARFAPYLHEMSQAGYITVDATDIETAQDLIDAYARFASENTRHALGYVRAQIGKPDVQRSLRIRVRSDFGQGGTSRESPTL